MNSSLSDVPPGFRFHPTEEELVDYYLRKKISSKTIDLDVIKDVDLYKIEPWDLQELCRIGNEDQEEWYFFSHKDKKYPTGTRTNRATKAGFWKATGRDKAIYANSFLIGMRKTLVFYKGRAPNGQKSDWIMHEYRLETNENGAPQEEGWVVCKVFIKRTSSTTRNMVNYESPSWYEDLDLPTQISQTYISVQGQCHSKEALGFGCNVLRDPYPQLESPKVFQPLIPYDQSGVGIILRSSTLNQEDPLEQQIENSCSYDDRQEADHVTDWRIMDKYVASQLSNDQGAPSRSNYSNEEVFHEPDDINMLDDDE